MDIDESTVRWRGDVRRSGSNPDVAIKIIEQQNNWQFGSLLRRRLQVRVLPIQLVDSLIYQKILLEIQKYNISYEFTDITDYILGIHKIYLVKRPIGLQEYVVEVHNTYILTEIYLIILQLIGVIGNTDVSDALVLGSNPKSAAFNSYYLY